jgi:glutamyl-tRNA reductase
MFRFRALREKAMAIQAETMDSIDRKLPGLSERERKIITFLITT